MFRRLCYVCGDPCSAWYCAAHADLQWADKSMPNEHGVFFTDLTELHGYWLEKFTPDTIRELASHLEEAA